MTRILMRMVRGHLVPTDEASAEGLAHLRDEEVVTVTVKKARNPKLHQLYWALISKVLPSSKYKTRDELHAAMKVYAGIYTPITLSNGQEVRVPGSISFDDMDELQFREFIRTAFDAVAKYIIPGISNRALREEVEQMIGAKI